MITTQEKIKKTINACKDSINMCNWRGSDDSKYQNKLDICTTVSDYIGSVVTASEFVELPLEVQKLVSTVTIVKSIDAYINKATGKISFHHWCNSWSEDIQDNERMFLIGLRIH
jgi:hypothetical protein